MRENSSSKMMWLLFILVVPGVLSNYVLNASSVMVQVDSTMELECSLDKDGNDSVVWKLDKLALAIGPLVLTRDPKVAVAGKDAKLMVRSAKESEKSVYYCHLRSTVIKERYTNKEPEFECFPLGPIDNGHQYYSPELKDNHVLNGTVVYHECNSGFELVGSNVTTCSSLTNGWDGIQPFCVNDTIYEESLTPAIVARMRLKNLGHQMESLSKQQDALNDQLDDLMSDLRQNVSSMNDVSRMVTRAVESVVERLLNRPVARTKMLPDGRYVNEYIWRVPKVLEELGQNKSNHYLLSPRFYARLPGYAMQLRFYTYFPPNNIGLYAGLVPGEFDDELQWPFQGIFELAILGRKFHGVQVSDIVRQYDTENESGCSNRTFYRPRKDDLQACGFKDMMSYFRLQKMPKNYLDDSGAMNVRFRLY